MENITRKISYTVFALLGVPVFLYYSREILIPIVFAFLIWFIILIFKKFLEKIKVFNHQIPNFLQNIISTIIVFVLIFAISSLVADNANEFAKVFPEYKENVNAQILKLSEYTNVNIVEGITNYIKGINFSKVLYSSFGFVTNAMGTLFLILIYVIFLSGEKKYFKKKLQSSFKNSQSLKHTELVLEKISYSIQRYLSLKSTISLLTAGLSYIVLVFVGVDFAFLWAFLIFIFNFLPNIGSIIATFFPTAIALIQFPTITEGIIVLISITVIQLIVGNVVEPKVIGNSLNLSSFVVILSLVFWGAVWGIAGMFLSVPLMVILMIILSNIEKTKPIAIWLSATGEVSKVKGIEKIK
ncbi:hypothetical protein CSB11_01485 [Candidatus Campbellbacteria bacterium]|nr:MAG: hypothetical protein CSB11_01485 [Candidatus Campbellbacteria bacterium]